MTDDRQLLEAAASPLIAWQEDWQEGTAFEVATGRVVGFVRSNMRNTRWIAEARGCSVLGEYMTKDQAKAAVVRAAASMGETK